MNRIDRLTAILIQLQTKKVVRAEEIASRFEISLRTVYRDVKALMEAGVPIGSEAGKGYFIVDGYHLPPVMFTQSEASALVLAGKLVEKMTDKSIRQEFESALFKIQSVLHDPEKDHLEILQSHIEVSHKPKNESEFPDHFLRDIQKAAVDKAVLEIEYLPSYGEESSTRQVEPIGLFYYGEAWHLIAWCRLRNGYRDFRADRILSLKTLNLTFDARNLFTLKEYMATVIQSNREMEEVTVDFKRTVARYVGSTRYTYGFVSEEEVNGKIRMTFLTCYLHGICRWLLSFGSDVEIQSPEKLKDTMGELVDELTAHYKRQARLQEAE
jgi:predicted DNA-binding transcriptional regulator YafY